MKLKTIFASMVVLGLVGSTAFAAQQRGDIAMLKDHAATAQKSNTGNWLSDHVKVGAQLNVDAGFSNRTRSNSSGLSGSFANDDAGKKSSSDIYLHNTNVSVDIMPNNWVDGHVEFTGNDSDNNVSLNEAYVTVGDLSKSPFFMSAGKEHLPFGYYEVNPLTPTLTQELSQFQGTIVNLGYAQAKGFYGSGYLTRGSTETADASNNHKNINNGGLDVGYKWCDKASQSGFTVGASWLDNLQSADGDAWTNDSKVGALALHLDGHMQQFDASADLVSQTNKIDDQGSSRFFAFGLGGGYSFNMVGHESRVGLGYQGSRHLGGGVNVSHVDYAMPKHRFLADWTVGVMKNTNVELQYTYDKDYATDGDASQADNGTGMSASTIKARLSVDLL